MELKDKAEETIKNGSRTEKFLLYGDVCALEMCAKADQKLLELNQN